MIRTAGRLLAGLLVAACTSAAPPSGSPSLPSPGGSQAAVPTAGPSGSPGDPLVELLRAAADATIATETAQIERTISYRGSTSAPEGLYSHESGGVALGEARRMAIEGEFPGAGGGLVEMRLHHDLLLLRGNFLQGGGSLDKWLVVDLTSDDPRVADYRIYAGERDGPTLFLYFLYGATDVRSLGAASLDGVLTAQYTADLDLQRAAQLMPEPFATAVRANLAEGAKVGANPVLRATVWIDDAGHVRGIDTVNDLAPQAGGGEEHHRLRFNGLGEPLDLQIPADEDLIYLEDIPAPSPGTAT